MDGALRLTTIDCVDLGATIAQLDIVSPGRSIPPVSLPFFGLARILFEQGLFASTKKSAGLDH